MKLEGNNLVRFIYMDEAGISASEPVAVVAGVIVNVDRQLALVEERVQELLIKYAPAGVEVSHFHATDIFSGRKEFKRPEYPLERAIELLKALISIPWEFGLPVAISAVRNHPLAKSTPETRRKHEGMSHAVAFSLCAMMAERYIREKADASEVGKLLAENNTTTRERIKEAQEMLGGKFRTAARERIFGLYVGATENSLPLKRIRSSVLFAGKSEEPMLQIADAVAFTVRRFYDGKADIEQFMKALLGDSSYRPPPLEGDAGGMSTILGWEHRDLP